MGRLELAGDETLVDVGCGTGRLTERLLERLPRGRVVALDYSLRMLQVATTNLRPRFAGRVWFVRADGAGLPLRGAADVIFSTATFHWILDHDRLFRSLHAALAPGGRLVAQCGGGPNLARLIARMSALAAEPAYARSSRAGGTRGCSRRRSRRRGGCAAAGFDERRDVHAPGAGDVLHARGVRGLRRVRVRAASPRAAARGRAPAVREPAVGPGGRGRPAVHAGLLAAQSAGPAGRLKPAPWRVAQVFDLGAPAQVIDLCHG